MAKVELKNLTKKYGEVIAVQNMNLTIPHNEFLVLVGPSGCGKSTFQKAWNLVQPSVLATSDISFGICLKKPSVNQIVNGTFIAT